MPTIAKSIIRDESTLSMVLLAILCGLFALALETVFHVSLKMPGHRALPGAMALLVMAETFTPLVLFGLAVAIPAILVGFGSAGPEMLLVWIAAAAFYAAVKRTKLNRKTAYFLLGGGLFGLFRFLSLSVGFHHTPSAVRLFGHLGFGILGGLIAFGAVRGVSRKKIKP